MSGRGGKRDHVGGAKEWRPFSSLGHRIGDDELVPTWIPQESTTGETASGTRQGEAMMIRGYGLGKDVSKTGQARPS